MSVRVPMFDPTGIDNAMQDYVSQKKLAGVQVLLAHRDRVIHRHCYGYANLVKKTPMKDDTIFRIFSMTKPITSLAVMMLWEEGHFDLHDAVSDFLPSFQHLQVYNPQGSPLPLARPITFHDLLTHTSGLGYGLDQSSPVERLYARANILRMEESLADKMERITALPLHHQPGERFTYSVATDVLGHLVELISGKRLDIFLKERIFDPLGMTDTAFSITKKQQAYLATLYTKFKNLPLLDVRLAPPFLRPTFLRGAWVNKTHQPAFLSGGGGLVSTMNDYYQFVRMLARQGELNGNRLISVKTYATMTAPQLTEQQNPNQGINLGYGVSVLTDPAKAQLPASPGSIGGSGAAGTDFWIDPIREMIGILMIQYVSFQPVSIALNFARLALGNPHSEANHEPA
jgi:CubicO group peptidase (beta-lactamase class C family)